MIAMCAYYRKSSASSFTQAFTAIFKGFKEDSKVCEKAINKGARQLKHRHLSVILWTPASGNQLAAVAQYMVQWFETKREVMAPKSARGSFKDKKIVNKPSVRTLGNRGDIEAHDESLAVFLAGEAKTHNTKKFF